MDNLELDLTQYRRLSILEDILDRQDLGGESKKYLVDCVKREVTPNSIDPITDCIMDALLNSNTAEEVFEKMTYSIDMLKRAKDALEKWTY